MTVKHRTWRLASLIAVSLVVGSASLSQAGIIPWVYDAVFGPVRSPAWGYSSYGYSGGYGYSGYTPHTASYAPYSYGYASYGYPSYNSGCSTCSTNYGWSPAWGCNSCSSGCSMGSCGSGCGVPASAASCNSCGVSSTYSSLGSSNYSPEPCLNGGCDGYANPKATTKTPAPAQSNKSGTNWSKSTEPSKTTTPKTPNRTFQQPVDRDSSDGLNDGSRSRSDDNGLNDNPTKAFRPSQGDSETILPSRPKPAPFDDLDNTPKSENNNGSAKRRLPLPRLNLDAKIAWRTEPIRTRVPFHAKPTNVTVARRALRIDTDWTPVAQRLAETQLVKK